MKSLNNIRRSIEHLRTAPGEELGRWAKFIRFQLRLWRFCARRLWENNVTAMSAALSFRTILAMIPAMVLAVLVLRAIGVVDEGKQSLRQFLDGSGFAEIKLVAQADSATAGQANLDPDPIVDTPTSGEASDNKLVNVADEIERLVARVESKLTFRRLGPVGVALLIWTAITLLTTIERSLNRVFGAVRSRSIGLRIALYWSVLTLGPLVLITTSYLGQSAVRTFEGVASASWLLVLIGKIGPGLVAIFVVAAVYKLMPNTKVRYRAAVGGALVSVPLWLIAKWGFSVYVDQFVSSGNLYGAIGLLPLFLIWLNLSWLIFLFGAQLAHTAANLSTGQLDKAIDRSELEPGHRLAAAVAIARAYLGGCGPVSQDDIAEQLGLTDAAVQQIADDLAQGGIVQGIEDGEQRAFVLAQPPELISLLAIIGVGGWKEAEPSTRMWNEEIQQIVAEAWRRLHSRTGSLMLSDVLAGPE